MWLIQKMQRRGYGDNYAIIDAKKKFAGLAFVLKNDDIALLDYFAISKRMRGCGYGTQALTLLKSTYSHLPLVLEIEDPDLPSENREERRRRARFYEACGMRMMDYRVSLFGVDMRILTSGETVSFERYHNLLSTVFGELFSKNIVLLH